MYLARLPEKPNGNRYVIRHSYAVGDTYRSRDLFDLGRDPARFIIYPGGNGFYIDPAVEEAIAAQGLWVSQDDLEPLFMPFLAPHIRRVITGFDRKSRVIKRADTGDASFQPHLFDRYRLSYLKFGKVESAKTGRAPDRLFSTLQCKSRDEIEHDFIAAERILKPSELRRYVYQIFNLQRFFTERFAGSHPESLDQERMDCFFLKTVCELNCEKSFWMGCEPEAGLRRHLVRYVIMYFDGYFPSHDPFAEFLRNFQSRYRIYRQPESVRISLEEFACLFGVSRQTLEKMDCRALTRLYRKQALRHHPDTGGDPETFLKLNAAYEKLARRKS